MSSAAVSGLLLTLFGRHFATLPPLHRCSIAFLHTVSPTPIPLLIVLPPQEVLPALKEVCKAAGIDTDAQAEPALAYAAALGAHLTNVADFNPAVWHEKV